MPSIGMVALKKEYLEGRRRELAKIHVAKKNLGLDELTYRAMLQEVAGVSSSADLDAKGRKNVIAHLVARGFQPTRGKTAHPGTPHNLTGSGKSRLLRRVEALLSEMQKPWAYAEAISKRMHSIEKIAWCSSKQLMAIITALERNKIREASK